VQKAADWAASTQIQRVLIYLKVVGFVKADMSVIHSNFKLHEIAPGTNGKAMGVDGRARFWLSHANRCMGHQVKKAATTKAAFQQQTQSNRSSRISVDTRSWGPVSVAYFLLKV
jgi:hypothetical protein